MKQASGDGMKHVAMNGRLRPRALAVAMALALAGCGGGGGGGGGAPLLRPDAPPPAPPPADPVVYDPNPDFSKHLTLTGAGAAHEAGFTGEGIRIGVIDSGVNRNHPALYPRVVDNLVYLDPDRNDLSVDDVVGHGSAVSQIMAGTAFGEWPGGIAPGAEIVSARIISDEPPEDDGSGKGNEIDGAVGLAPIHQDLIERGVRIMNNSWGGLYWTNPEATAPIAQEYRPFIIENGGLVVFSTGNESFDNPSSMAALPSQPGPDGTYPAADLERGWIAVAALDSDAPTRLAEYSNKCGMAMNYCLAAPGDIVATGTDDAPDAPTYWSWSGTSFSAPIVSGAAALVWEQFPYFDNDLVRQTLLGTATDLGAPGVDATFGYGALDIAKAINGPAKLDWGDVIVDFDDGEGGPAWGDADSSRWRNDISGSGGIIKRGSGALLLYGNNSYTGGTTLESGFLGAMDTDLPGDVLVEEGLLLLRDASVGGDLVVNAGDLQLLSYNPSGFEHVVGGDLVLGAGILYRFDIGSRLQVDGSAALDGHVLVTGLIDGYQYQETEQILHADGGISGSFTSLSADEGLFLEAELSYTADTVSLEIDRLDVNATAEAMGFSATAMSGANRVEGAFRLIDGGAEGEVDGFTDGAGALQRTPTASAAEQSLASLSGELHQAGAALALMAIDGNRHALESHLDSLPAAVGASAWADRLNGQRPGSYMNFDANGWVLGLDQSLGHGVVGVAFGESQGAGWHALRGDRERSRQVEGQLYGAWNFGDSYLLGRLAHGRSERDVQRQILLGRDVFGVDSDYAYRYSTVGLQFGHRLHWGDATFTPYVGAQRLRLQREGFVEHGAAGFGLSTADSTMTADQAMAGVRFEHGFRLGGQQWNWHGRIERQQPLDTAGATIEARFTGLDVWSPIGADALLQPATVFGVGLDTRTGRRSWLSFGVDCRRQAGRTHAAGFARWSVGF